MSALPPKIRIPAGTPIFHGTAANSEFTMPVGPAFFTFDEETAAYWATPLPERQGVKGQPRVLAYRLHSSVDLFDTRHMHSWNAVALSYDGGVDAPIHNLARLLLNDGEAGWYGRSEVMLTTPEQQLVFESVRHVRLCSYEQPDSPTPK